MYFKMYFIPVMAKLNFQQFNIFGEYIFMILFKRTAFIWNRNPNNIKIVTVTFNQCNVFLLNKSISIKSISYRTQTFKL